MIRAKKIKASIIGASGYTGAELVRLLIHHPNVEIVSLIAERSAGHDIEEVYSHFRDAELPRIISLEEASWKGVDVAFCCLPHATTQDVITSLPNHLKIIDLSADFRLKDIETYATWYGHEHKAPKLQESAVYGLPELYRKEIKKASLVACPGCYPTSALLPLAPLLKAVLIQDSDIIIDAKSGVTGAGRSLKQKMLFCETNEGVTAYGVCKHRHIPEMEQVLSECAGDDITVNFSPQLIPMSRGIISTIYVKLAADNTALDIESALRKYYEKEPFVTILEHGALPSTRDVHGTNKCHISVVEGRTPGRVVLVSVIDNLTKGSSGQAVQNMNLMFGLDEKAGLHLTPVFP
jgi:N-acetyl-gamma-glutamyl-phosphate reductase